MYGLFIKRYIDIVIIAIGADEYVFGDDFYERNWAGYESNLLA